MTLTSDEVLKADLHIVHMCIEVPAATFGPSSNITGHSDKVYVLISNDVG